MKSIKGKNHNLGAVVPDSVRSLEALGTFHLVLFAFPDCCQTACEMTHYSVICCILIDVKYFFPQHALPLPGFIFLASDIYDHAALFNKSGEFGVTQ